MLSQKIMYLQFCRTKVTYAAYIMPCNKCSHDAERYNSEHDYCAYYFKHIKNIYGKQAR